MILSEISVFFFTFYWNVLQLQAWISQYQANRLLDGFGRLALHSGIIPKVVHDRMLMSSWRSYDSVALSLQNLPFKVCMIVHSINMLCCFDRLLWLQCDHSWCHQHAIDGRSRTLHILWRGPCNVWAITYLWTHQRNIFMETCQVCGFESLAQRCLLIFFSFNLQSQSNITLELHAVLAATRNYLGLSALESTFYFVFTVQTSA